MQASGHTAEAINVKLATAQTMSLPVSKGTSLWHPVVMPVLPIFLTGSEGDSKAGSTPGQKHAAGHFEQASCASACCSPSTLNLLIAVRGHEQVSLLHLASWRLLTGAMRAVQACSSAHLPGRHARPACVQQGGHGFKGSYLPAHTGRNGRHIHTALQPSTHHGRPGVLPSGLAAKGCGDGIRAVKN